MGFLWTIFFYKEKKALAFNWDRCCHLSICLQLILFHWKTQLHKIFQNTTGHQSQSEKGTEGFHPSDKLSVCLKNYPQISIAVHIGYIIMNFNSNYKPKIFKIQKTLKFCHKIFNRAKSTGENYDIEWNGLKSSFTIKLSDILSGAPLF